jgi:hypothetical protein
MKEGVLHIQLVYGPTAGVSHGEDSADSGGFDYETEGFIVVNTRSLGEAAKDPTSLVSVQGTISMKLVLENPFSSDNVGLVGTGNKITGNKIPGAVGGEGFEFFLHGSAPERIGKSFTDGPGQRRQSLGVQGGTGLAVANFSTSCHAMRVGNRGYWNCTSRQRRACLDVARWRRDDARPSRRSSNR